MFLLGDNKCINLDNYINFISDPKTADWPLVATPWPTVAFVAAYLFIVKVGPKLMETRNAYSLREVLLVYNFSLVLLSAWMTYEVRAAEVSVLLWSVVLRFSNISRYVSAFQSIASAMDIPNFNFVCQSIPYIRGDEKRNRVSKYWRKRTTHGAQFRTSRPPRMRILAILTVYQETQLGQK